MPLTAYFALENVYQFHEVAENWILRRYQAQTGEADGAETVRPQWGEMVVAIFPDRSTKRTEQLERGQTANQQITVYLRTRILVTDTNTPQQPTDVLFDPQGRAWQCLSTGEWDEAKGFSAVLQRSGRRGERPWV